MLAQALAIDLKSALKDDDRMPEHGERGDGRATGIPVGRVGRPPEHSLQRSTNAKPEDAAELLAHRPAEEERAQAMAQAVGPVIGGTMDVERAETADGARKAIEDTGVHPDAPVSEHSDGHAFEHAEELTEYDLVEEANEDWRDAQPVIDEILIKLQDVSEPTRRDCRKLVIRIRHKGEVVVQQGGSANQNLVLSVVNDQLMLTDTIEEAPAADSVERELLDEIGNIVKKKLGLRVWALLSKLGKVQEWTVNGDVGVSIFGMLKGSCGLSVTFGK